MNIRKPTDYSAMFKALDGLMAASLPQMQLYSGIGRLVSDRPEKGAAVAAAEYLCDKYPEAAVFSPRNLRRMHEFFRTYGSAPEIMAKAMTIGWTQNVVILEAELTLQERAWYIQASGSMAGRSWSFSGKSYPKPIWKTLSTWQRICAILRKTVPLRSSLIMTRILFTCYGNICRSPMAEFIMKDLVKKAGLETQFHIESAATSAVQTGNPVYPPARRKLAEHGISCAEKTARQLVKTDYERYDLLIGMDRANLRDMRRVCGGDPDGKIHLLMEYTSRPADGFRPADGLRPGDVADPWYTGDFEATWRDVLEGCRGLLKNIEKAGYGI